MYKQAELIAQIKTGGHYYNILTSLGFVATITFVACMESRIQKYKARRAFGLQNGTWTEEERQKSKKIFKF